MSSLFQLNSVKSNFTSELPADQDTTNSARQVYQSAYSFVTPKKTSQPALVAVTEILAEQLGLSSCELSTSTFVDIVSGNMIPDGMEPYAMCYGGHQFGQWAGQLGDGRAINLGQVQTSDVGLQTLQLKGAGPTPYSRGADGFAVLRSSVREFLCSEAMYHLGIPTTRALSLCLTGDEVQRDMFYDGHAKNELGAVVCRVSTSFLRFGSFQLPAARDDIQLLKRLVDFSIKENFPHLGEPNKDVYLKWFGEICQSTCDLVIEWMRVGFVHGVMNTDNMSIIGETIDYGPYGWTDNFDLSWTPNTTDSQHRRYCFGAQPEIAQWNLLQLANAIYPLVEEAEPFNHLLNNFARQYSQGWSTMMQKKLGLDQLMFETDDELFVALEKLMTEGNIDMTIFYRCLSSFTGTENDPRALFLESFYNVEELSNEFWFQLEQWLESYSKRLLHNQSTHEERKIRMNTVNPKYVLRNYLAQQAIEKAESGDYSMIKELQQVLLSPYCEQPEFEDYAKKRPDWALRKAGCSKLSCSS